MSKLIPILVITMFLAPTIAFAQNEAEIQQFRVDNPDSITPDSPLYFFDLLFDNIFLGIQSNDVDRAKLAIKIADERLVELKIMIFEKRFDLADNVLIEHDRVIGIAEEAITRINLVDAIIEAKEKLEIERDVENHREKIRRTSDDLEIRVEVRGDLTPEQIERIRILLDNVDDRVEFLEIRIDNEIEEVEIKLREQTGDSATEVKRDILMLQQRIDRETTEIDVEFEGNVAMVETEIGGTVQIFPVNSLDADVIIKAIIDRTGLLEEQIRNIIEFEDESRERTLDSIKQLQFLGRN